MERMALPWGAPAPVLATTARPLFTAQQAQTVLAGATYDFGPAKGYLQWYRAELDSARAATIKLHIWQLGTSVRAGDGDVLASWVRTAKEQVGVADQHRDTVTVAYDYRLSKRTDVYLALMRDKAGGGPQAAGESGGAFGKLASACCSAPTNACPARLSCLRE
eukprot:gene9975-13348_t